MKNNISYAEYVNEIKKKIVDKVDANGGKLRFLRELNGYIDTIEVRKENDLYVVDAVMEHMVMLDSFLDSPFNLCCRYYSYPSYEDFAKLEI